MSDDEDSQGYIGSVDTESQADSIDDFLEDTVSVSELSILVANPGTRKFLV